MTDLIDLLDRAAGRPDAPTPDVLAGDLRRGRRALLHRRWARGSAVVLAGAAAVAAAMVVPGVAHRPTPTQVQVAGGGGGASSDGPVTPAARAAVAAVALVPNPAVDKRAPYAAQLAPAGWHQQVTAFAMMFAPPDSSSGPDDFGGKLLVMVAPDQTAATGAHGVRVGGVPGTLSSEDGTSILVFTPAGGRQVVVQAPPALGWDQATLLRFAESVAIRAGARGGVG